MIEKKVSIIVTTKNEAANIVPCLKSLCGQTYSYIEIIVVDNGSTDGTKDAARKYTDKVYDKGPERSAQRNYGMIDIAEGEFVMFVDADMIFPPCLAEVCVRHMENNDCAALHISEVILGTGFWSRVRRFERSFYDATVVDGARFFRKEVFERVGGFDVSMSGPEDWDIDKKIKQIGHIDLLPNVPSASVTDWDGASFLRERGVEADPAVPVIYHNEAELRLIPYLRKKGYYAVSMDGYVRKWGAEDPDIQKQLGLGYRYFGVFAENGKWKRCCAHPVLTACMFALRLAVGSVYLGRRFFD